MKPEMVRAEFARQAVREAIARERRMFYGVTGSIVVGSLVGWVIFQWAI
jgi:hypothetical protein